MARKTQKVMSLEEILEIQKKNEKAKFEQQHMSEQGRKLCDIHHPTYYLDVGTHFKYGGFKDCIIDEVLYDGIAYGCLCYLQNNSGEEIAYRVIPWMHIKPNNGKESFATNQDIRLIYHSSDIDELIGTFYTQGIDTNPDYQRDYVWDDDDRELLIDSIFNNIGIGNFVLINRSDSEWMETNKSYEILDGKQRLLTIIAYYENRFPYKGVYFNDLSLSDKRAFKRYTISVAKVHETSKKNILRLFVMLNRAGKTMEKEHLETVQKMMEDLED